MLNNWRFWANGALIFGIAATIFSAVAFLVETNWEPYLFSSVWLLILSRIWFRHSIRMRNDTDKNKKGK